MKKNLKQMESKSFIFKNNKERKMILQKKYQFDKWSEWDHTLYNSATNFIKEFGFSPNILLANDYTYSQFDFITTINPEKKKNATRIDGVKEPEDKKDINLSVYKSGQIEIRFCIDNIEDKEFILVYDDESDEDDTEEIPIEFSPKVLINF